MRGVPGRHVDAGQFLGYASFAMLLRRLLAVLFALALVAQGVFGSAAQVFAATHPCSHADAAGDGHAAKCPCCGDCTGALDCEHACAPAFVASAMPAMTGERIEIAPRAADIAAQGRATLPLIRPPIA